jgi:hypothetical protein
MTIRIIFSAVLLFIFSVFIMASVFGADKGDAVVDNEKQTV